MSSSANGNTAKSDAGRTQEKEVGSSADFTPPVAGASAATPVPLELPQAARHGGGTSASSTSTSAAAQSRGGETSKPSGKASKGSKSRGGKASEGVEVSMPMELTAEELAEAVASIWTKFDATWVGHGPNPRSSLIDAIAVYRALRQLLNYAAAQLAALANASKGGKHQIGAAYTFEAMRSLLQVVPVLRAADTRSLAAQSLSAPPRGGDASSNIDVGLRGIEPLWNLQRGEVKELLEQLLREVRAVQGVDEERLAMFGELIQHVVERQLVPVFQRYAQTRAKTLSTKERSDIAKAASVKAIKTKGAKKVVSGDGKIMNGLEAATRAGVKTQRAKKVVSGDGEIMNGLEAVSRAGVKTKRAQVVVGGDGEIRNGLEASADKASVTMSARYAAYQAALREMLHRTPQQDLEASIPDTTEDVLNGINGFAISPLLSYLRDQQLSARNLCEILPSAMLTMLGNAASQAAVRVFEGWSQQRCASDDSFPSKLIRDTWLVGRAFSQAWNNGKLKRLAAQIAPASSFSGMNTKTSFGVEYEYQAKLSTGGHRTGVRYRVSSAHGRTGVWCGTKEDADKSYFSDIHPRPYSTSKDELVTRLTLHRNKNGGKKVAMSLTPTKLIALIIKEEGAADGAAGGGAAGKKNGKGTGKGTEKGKGGDKRKGKKRKNSPGSGAAAAEDQKKFKNSGCRG